MSNEFGKPCSNRYEQILLNSSSYATAAASDSTDFNFDALVYGIPTRPTHAIDATAYGTQPATQCWETQMNGNGPIHPLAPVQV